MACPVSGVRSPATVDKTVTSFMDRSSPNLEIRFYVRCANRDFFSDRPLLPWERKFGNFNTKFAVSRPM